MTACIDDIDSFDASSFVNWALESSLWNGRKVHWTESSDFYQELQTRTLTLLVENPHLAARFAWLGSHADNQFLLAKEIAVFNASCNGFILQAGFRHSVSKFWKAHKKEILVGAAIVAAVTLIVVVSVCSAGTGAAAAASGAAALDSLNRPDIPPPLKKIIPQDAPAALLKEPVSPNQLVFQEKGLLIGGEYSSYEDILEDKKPCSQNFPELPPAAFPTSHPCERSWMGHFLETIGRSMIDPDLQNPNIPLPSSEHSICFATPGTRQPHLQISGINGMNTSLDQANSHADYLAQFAPNQSIDWVYNRSHGPILDSAEIFAFNYAGYSPYTADLLRENWTEFHKQNAGRPHAKYLQFCHSQGALHTRNALLNLPQEIRDRVIVVAIAPATIVPESACYKSFNYASKKDVVHFGELIFAGLNNADEIRISEFTKMTLDHRQALILLDPHEDAKGIDHDYQSPTFKKKISDHVLDYTIHNGEYQ